MAGEPEKQIKAKKQRRDQASLTYFDFLPMILSLYNPLTAILHCPPFDLDYLPIVHAIAVFKRDVLWACFLVR